MSAMYATKFKEVASFVLLQLEGSKYFCVALC